MFELDDTVIASFLKQAANNKGKSCLVFPTSNQVFTYGDVEVASRRAARLLRDAGVHPGAIVMIFLPTGVEAYAAFLGSMLLGAVPTYMPGPSPKQEPGQYWRDHIALLHRTEPHAIVTDDATVAAMNASGMLDACAVELIVMRGDGAPLLRDETVFPAPTDIALLQHSSGTTGLKKGVMLSHAAIVSQIAAYAEAIEASAEDIVSTWLPIYHDMGLISSTLLPLMIGQTIIVLDPFLWASRPVSLFQIIDKYRATLCWLPNFAFEHLVRTVDVDGQTFDLSCVRAFIDCSEPCRPSTFSRFLARFARYGVRPDQLQVSYAMAETVFAVTQTRLGTPPRVLVVSEQALRAEGRARDVEDGETPLALLSNGPALEGMKAWPVRPDGTLCTEREVGELMVAGHCLFDGYFRIPDMTAERLTEAGLKTRDMGFVLDREVYVLGRMDDLIIVHGRNFYAGEVEAAVNLVPGIKPGRAVAFGVDNAEAGSQEMVVVVESDEDAAQWAQLSKRIKRQAMQQAGLALYEARIVAPGWLHKTTSGKISRSRNRARYLEEKRASSR